MNNEKITDRVAEVLGMDPAHTQNLEGLLSVLIRNSLTDGNAIAIPGFGTFEVREHEEYVATDSATGRKMLVPPSYIVDFIAGSRLKKSTKPHTSV